MRRWIPRTLYAMLLGVALPATLNAQQPVPVTPAPLPAAGVPVPAPVVVGNPYIAATPYNPTVVGQMVPNPQYNRPIYTLPCDIPNMNLTPYEPTKPDCFGRLFGRGGCNSGGCGA